MAGAPDEHCQDPGHDVVTGGDSVAGTRSLPALLLTAACKPELPLSKKVGVSRAGEPHRHVCRPGCDRERGGQMHG